MARRTVHYTIMPSDKPNAPPNRDLGKKFIITEMSPFEAESWAIRALLALMANNVVLPAGMADRIQAGEAGLADLAAIGLPMLAGVKYHDAKPLLDDMLSCVQIAPDKRNPDAVVRPLVEDDIEELSTIIELRRQVWRLHVNFSTADATQTTAT